MSNMTGFEQFWIFFIFGKKCYTYPILFIFFGGGAKNPKNVFNQFSRHPMQFWTTFIFFMFGKKCFTFPIFFSTNFLAISNKFDFFYFPGWVGEIKNKANLSPAELELGLSLAIFLEEGGSLSIIPYWQGLVHVNKELLTGTLNIQFVSWIQSVENKCFLIISLGKLSRLKRGKLWKISQQGGAVQSWIL